MKHRHLKCLYLVFIVLHFSLPSWVCADHAEDTWIEPDAWTREHLTLSTSNNNERCCKCPEDSLLPEGAEGPLNRETSKYTEDGVALVYYKKLISLLFNRRNLLHCDALQTYERYLSFSVSISQLEKLEQLKDPRDLDDVITEIFANARNNKPNTYSDGHYRSTADKETGFKALIFDIFRDLFQLTKTSEIRFLLIAALVVIFGWFLNKQYRISWLSLAAGGLFLFGYVHTYLECNRELEVNEMMEAIQRNKHSAETQSQSRLVGFLKSIFSSSNAIDLEEHQMLKKSTKLSLGFCRPDHVIIMYFNDIFLKYLEVLLEKCTHTLSTLQGGLSFPYNMFASVMLICIIGYMLKLTFKYILSPTAWSHAFRQPHAHVTQHAALPQVDSNGHNAGDRISGDNLKILLNALSTTAITKQPPLLHAVSGVEEVREAIDSAPTNNTSTSSSDTSSPCKNNNTSKSSLKDDRTDVLLEDLPNDT